MKRVLIVDDELLVRMGFRSLIDWEGCGFTVVGDAENGEEALEKIRGLKVDLVFTDLKMKHMDGFELMKACNHEYPSTKFIVLSSYNDFDSVRQAMRCGALDYVFKLDVKPEQLKKMLLEIKWDTPESGSEHQNTERAMRANLIRRAIAGDIFQNEAQTGFLRFFPAVIWNKPFRLITISIDDFELRAGSTSQKLSQSIMVEIESIISEVYSDCVTICPFQADRLLIIWQETDTNSLGWLQKAYARVEKLIKRYLNYSITAVISESHDHLGSLSQAHMQNEETLSYRYLLDHGRIHGYHLVDQEENTLAVFNSHELDNALSLKDGRSIVAACDSVFMQMSKRRGYPLQKLRVNLLDLLFLIKRVYPDMGTWRNRDGCTLARLIQCSDRLETVRNGFSEALRECTDVQEEKVQRKEIKLIIEYVRDHLNQDIGVSRAAQIVGLSESYFSHVFKREMGISFVDWINREKINRAMQLLNQSDMRVNEIGTHVGIDNPNYFSVLFKKLTGKSPLKMREDGKKLNSERKAENE